MGYEWPYENEINKIDHDECDVLVLGGGLAGCNAAIAAARHGKKVIMVEKGSTVRSGSNGTGFDHWEQACTNPCCKVTPEEMTAAFIEEQCHYSNGISHYIECREGYDRVLDMESFGGHVRDVNDEFVGASFRDPETKLLFAYDYTNRYTLRVWGSTFKPALYKECKRLGIKIYDYTEATALMCKKINGKNTCIGAVGMNTHTGKVTSFSSKSTCLCMSRPARVWLFSPDTPGLSEFRPFPSIGSGHAMGFRCGMELTMMEKSVRAEYSAAGRSFPCYSTGNNHNTWYAATMVDARGVELPYVDRDGNVLKTVDERYRPAKGQKFFLKGGVIDDDCNYKYRGPSTVPFDKLVEMGYKLPFFADLSKMPDTERRAIFGLMVGEEGKTKIPVYENLKERGFDPEKHILQSYGNGWQSASFLGQERQLFGAPGGVMIDWDLKTNIDGLYAAGDQLFASDCAGHAIATGYYAGRKAAANSEKVELMPYDTEFVKKEAKRLWAPLYVEEGLDWREVNAAMSKAMQNYCGGVKNDDLLKQGLLLLDDIEKNEIPRIKCNNPHELVRTHEVMDILTVSKVILNACMLRKASTKPLYFERTDNQPEMAEKEQGFITIYQENGEIKSRVVPFEYFGDVKTEYEKRNQDYMKDKR